MIKRYNQFVNGRVNENVDEEFDSVPPGIEEGDEDIEVERGIQITNVDTEEEEEEEGSDIYNKRLKEVADELGTEVTNGKVIYDGKEIIFPSETEMYHVDRKKFKTSQEVINYLKGSERTTESKSYKSRYK